MAVIASIFGLLGRFAGRLLTTTLGWASALLFGRIPEHRAVLFAVLTFGSIVWVALVAGVIAPDLGTLLIALVPLPDWVDEGVVRLAMLVAALVVPAGLGAVALLIADPADRPRGGGLIGAILRGYILTPVLAATLVILAAAGTVRKVRAILARRETAHVPIVVRPGRYEPLVGRLQEILRAADLATSRRDGSAVLTKPAQLLASISGTGLRSLVPDRLAVLVGPDLEVEVYPSDIAISGRTSALARTRAAILRELRSEDCWLTTRREAQEIEDRLAMVDGPIGPRDVETLAAIDRRLASEAIDDDEWDVLYRRRLQVVADAAGADLDPAAVAPGRAGPEASLDRQLRVGPGAAPGRGPLPDFATILGVVTAALVIADIVLAVRNPEQHR